MLKTNREAALKRADKAATTGNPRLKPGARMSRLKAANPMAFARQNLVGLEEPPEGGTTNFLSESDPVLETAGESASITITSTSTSTSTKRIFWGGVLVSLILLVLFAARPALACINIPYDATFAMEPRDVALAMPEPYFNHEVRRLLGLPDPEKSRTNRDHQNITAQIPAELKDLEAALKTARKDPAQTAKLLADYKALREAMAAVQGKDQPFDPAPHQALLSALPAEYGIYLEGAIASQNGDTTRALERWGAVLTLPEAERRHRAVWAAYMIGKSCSQNDPARALIFLGECNRLAAAGCADPLGLANKTLGWQARAELASGDLQQALTHYLEQGRQPGRGMDYLSLKIVCEKIAADSKTLADLAADETCRPVLTAWILSRSTEGEEHKPETELGRAWLKAVEAAKAKLPAAEAEDLAWLCYNAGDLEGARHWLALAPKHETMGRWIEAKLLLRDGEIERAVAALEALRRDLPTSESWHNVLYPGSEPDISPRAAVCRELSVIYLGQEKFVAALDAAIGWGHWEDISFITEREVTTAELEQYLKAHAGEIKTVQVEKVWSGTATDLGSALHALLARRLMRAGEWARARAAFAEGDIKHLPAVDKFIRDQKIAASPAVDDHLRATALFEAAMLARTLGMEMMGTELEPDWSLLDGELARTDPAPVRASIKEPREPYRSVKPAALPALPPDSALAKALAPKPAEKERLAESNAAPDRRFHYRYVASDMMWASAGMLPDNNPLLAAALWYGGHFIEKRDPALADKFYKALARRCAQLPIGQRAAKVHWFPAEPPPIPPLVIPTTIHVSPDGDDQNDGASWARAKRSIHAALATARLTGGAVWVAGGVYPEALKLEEGMAVLGSFRGDETSLAQRRPTRETLSIIDASAAGEGRPAGHAVTIDGLTSATLDGFLIRGGAARGIGAEGCGGGLWCRKTGPNVRIMNCILAGNRAAIRGGGLYLEAASPALTSCTLAGNRAEDSGGGLACGAGSQPRLEGCVFVDNGAQYGRGGAIFAEGTSLSVERCRLAGNWAAAGAGGGAALSAAEATFTNCVLSGNTAATRGGAIETHNNSEAILRYCTLAANKAASGGAVYLDNEDLGSFLNCIFADNRGSAIVTTQIKKDDWFARVHNYRHEQTAGPIKIEHSLFNANGPAHLRLSDSIKTSCTTAKAINAALGAASANLGGEPYFVSTPNAGKAKWTALPYYDPQAGTTVLVDRNADFTALRGRTVFLIPDTKRRTVVCVLAVRNKTSLEVLGDLTHLTAKGRAYRFLDERLANGSTAIGGGARLEGVPTDIDGRPRAGRSDLGAVQAPAGFTPSPDRTPPVSAARPLPEVTTRAVVTIPFRYHDEQSEMKSIRIFFKKDDSALIGYSRTEPAGGAVRFDATPFGDGEYRFWLSATDAAGNTEPLRAQPDARTRVVTRFPGRRVYVKAKAAPGGTGQDWAHALPSLDAAVELAGGLGIPEVWVAAGTYQVSVPVPRGVTLYGGFKGNEQKLEERNPARHVTTIKVFVSNRPGI